MGRRSSLLSIGARLPAIAFLAAILLLPNFKSDKSVSVPTSLLISDEVPETFSQVINLPDAVWESQNIRRKFHPSDSKYIHWYRIDVTSLPQHDGDWQLSVAGARIMDFSRVDFYLVSDLAVDDKNISKGDYSDTLVNEINQINQGYHFKFKPKSSAARIFVRTESLGDSVEKPLLYRDSDYEAFARLMTLQWSILNGCLIGLTLYALGLSFVLRDATYAYLGLWQASSIVIAFYFTGFLKSILPDILSGRGFEYRIAAVSFGLFFVFVYHFASKFFDYRRNFPKLGRYLKLHFYASFLVTAVFAVASPTVIVGLSVFMIASAIARNVIIYRGYMGQSFVFLFAAAVSLFIAGGLVFVLADLGLIEHTQVRECAFHLGAILSAATLSLSMSLRLKFMENRHKQIVNVFSKDGDLVRLNTLLNESFSGHYNTSRLDVSMMFVDIASFSEISLGHSQKEIYEELAAVMANVVSIIEEHNGSIDRSVGAGVLCLFGYKNVEKSFDPSLDAFNAACRIQEMNVARALDGQSKMIMPMRIGIHAAKVTVGNLGDQGRLDFTIIGSGVNLASRLKEACSPYKVILSAAVYEQLRAGARDVSRLTPIAIAIKHQSKLLDSYEFNPFGASGDLLQRAESVFLDHIGMRSLDQRFSIKGGSQISLFTNVGEFTVLDFSLYGFRAVGERLLGRQTVINAKIETSDAKVNALLDEALLSEFALEVRWSRKSDHGFEHGFKLHGGGSKQCDFIFKTISVALAGNEARQGVDEVVTEVAS
jgi:class 3 adenylate cyclase